MRFWFYITAVFISVTGVISATGGPYKFEEINIEQGLSRSTVYDIYQDKLGFMWFATANGLNKFDGYSFTVYTNMPGDTTSISDKGITSILEDKKGFLWLGTSDGTLNRFDRWRGEFRQFDISGPLDTEYEENPQYIEGPLILSRNNNRTITDMEDDGEGNIWISTLGNGLKRFNTKTGKTDHYYKSRVSGLRSNKILEIEMDQGGRLWVGTFEEGLAKINREEDDIYFTHYTFAGIDSMRITLLLDGKENNLYIGTYNGAFYNTIYAGVNDSIEYEEILVPSQSGTPVMAGCLDNDGIVWIGSFGGGLYGYNPSDKTTINFRSEEDNINSLSDNDILSLYKSNEGIVWIGSHLGHGIGKLYKEKNKFGHIKKSFKDKTGLNDDVVWAIEQDSSGKFWFGTYRGGINIFDIESETFEYLTTAEGLSDNHVRSLKTDKAGNMWVGTYSGGLNWIESRTGKIEVFRHDISNPASLGANQVLDIFIEQDSVFWISTFGGGLNRFVYDFDNPDAPVEFRRYKYEKNVPGTISSNRVYTVFRDSDSTLWVGTFGGGLNRLDEDTGEFVSYKNDPGNETSLSDNRVMAITEDANGDLWIGTYGGGLNRFDKKNGEFYRYNDSNGFYTNVVYGILIDSTGNLWFSTDNGIIRMNNETGNFLYYDRQDGVQSMEFSGGAYLQAKDGRIFMGGINGFNYFYPDKIAEIESVPPVYVTKFKIFDKPVSGSVDNIILSHKENFFSFEFAALDYFNPEERKYAYMLEGLNDKWNYTDAKSRVVNFTNLSPGDYIFRVMVTNEEGRWSDEKAAVSFTITPPFWQEGWFIFLAVLAITGILWSIYRVRLHQALAIEKLKSRVAADLHDNVGSGLTEISILSELTSHEIGNSSPEAQKHLGMISESARTLVDSMSDIVWVVNPARDSLRDLILRLKDAYSDVFTQMGISFKIKSIEKLDEIRLPLEYKQNLYLIFKEGLNNAIKHSKCKKIHLEANIKGNYIQLSLSDDGVGADVSKITYGNGIRNLQNRAAQIGGKLTWDTAPECGTRISFIGKVSAGKRLKEMIAWIRS